MKVTKKALIKISDAINSIKSENKVLTYSLVKNRKLIEAEITALEEARNFDTPAYNEYLTKIRGVAFTYGKKDEKGNVIQTPTGFITDDQHESSVVQEAINGINEEYKTAIEDRSAQIVKYNQILDETVEYDFCPINLSDLPDTVSKQLMDDLFDLIVE